MDVLMCIFTFYYFCKRNIYIVLHSTNITCYCIIDWNQKCHNESETANWILANTKKCPNCSSRIEKNQGCNHMNCKVCKHEFCWICMDTWVSHGQSTGGYYKCNRFDAAKTDSSATAAQKAKQELDR